MEYLQLDSSTISLPEPDTVSRMHSALWTGVIQHRSKVAEITRRYCLITEHHISLYKLLTSSQVSSNSSKSLLGINILRVKYTDVLAIRPVVTKKYTFSSTTEKEAKEKDNEENDTTLKYAVLLYVRPPSKPIVQPKRSKSIHYQDKPGKQKEEETKQTVEIMDKQTDEYVNEQDVEKTTEHMDTNEPIEGHIDDNDKTWFGTEQNVLRLNGTMCIELFLPSKEMLKMWILLFHDIYERRHDLALLQPPLYTLLPSMYVETTHVAPPPPLPVLSVSRPSTPPLINDTDGTSSTASNSVDNEIDQHVAMVCVPKALVVACRRPWYDSMSTILLQLFRNRQQHEHHHQEEEEDGDEEQNEMNQMSSEELIVHLLHDMHAPSPGGRTIEIPCPSVLDLPISLRKAMFNVSNLGRLPSTQLNFNFLFSKKMELETTETTEQKYLSFPNFMSVWTMLLLEKKIIVHSKYVWLVPTFLETLRTLMFPLTWENVYIPMVNNFCLIIFV